MRWIASLFLLFGFAVNAANHYILDGGSGDGTSWSSPLDALPATLTRGDTYYIGDGSYAGYEFDDAHSGDTLITIKKATAADHGTETGWSSTYGDGVATWGTGHIRFSRGNYVFDGAVGGGPGAWDSGHGFVLARQAAATDVYNMYFRDSSTPTTVTNITVRHSKLYFPDNVAAPHSQFVDQHNVYVLYGNNIWFEHCAFTYPSAVHIFLFGGVSDVGLDKCFFYFGKAWDPTSGGVNHTEILSAEGNSRIRFSNSFFKDCTGTGWLVNLSRAGGAQDSDDWEIYGNIFFDTRTRTDGAYSYSATDGTIVVINGEQASGWVVANNSFININGSGSTGNAGITFAQGTTTSGGHLVYNNLWYNPAGTTETPNISFVSGDSTSVHDYSAFDDNMTSPPSEANDQIYAGDPFTSYDTEDFSLATPLNAGYSSLGAPYNVDMFGVTRGADGVWDRGAIEFDGSPATRRATLSGSGVFRNATFP